MKSLVAAVAAASLVGMTMAQGSAATQNQRRDVYPPGHFMPIPTKQQLQFLDQKQRLDACHKADSRTSDGWVMPCLAQRMFDVEFCRLEADTDAARKDQQACMCKTSSFLKDFNACLDCKLLHSLLSDAQYMFYVAVVEVLQQIYCTPLVVTKTFYSYYLEAVDMVKNKAPYNGVEPGFTVPSSAVERQIHSAHPRDYYSRVGAPEKQGEGNFTSSTALQNMPTVNKTVVNPIPDAVSVPVMVIAALDDAADAKNASHSAGPTATPVVGRPLPPTTLLRVAGLNSTARATASLSASLSQSVPSSLPSSVPADVKSRIIPIEGKLCLVYIYFAQVNFHCSKSPQGEVNITQKTERIEWSYGFQLETKEQFDQLANVRDACTAGNCEGQISYIERVEKVSIREIVQKETVVPVKPQQLPPPEKPTTGNSGVSDNIEPADEDDDGCLNDDLNNAPANNTPTQGASGSPTSGNSNSSGPVVPQKNTGSSGTVPPKDTKGPVSTQQGTDSPAGPAKGNPNSSGTVPHKDTKGPVSTQEDITSPISSQKGTNGPAGPAKGNPNSSGTVPHKDTKGPVSTQEDITSPISSQKGTNGPTGPAKGNPNSSGTVPQKDTKGPVSTQEDTTSPISSQKGTDGPTGPSSSQSECSTCSEEREDGTAVCAEKEEIQTSCETKSGEEQRNCLCRSGLFNAAIKCARRALNCFDAEFRRQVLLETEDQFCGQKKHSTFKEALASVKIAWSERAPRSELM